MTSWEKFSNCFLSENLCHFWVAVDSVTNEVLGTIGVVGLKLKKGGFLNRGCGWPIAWKIKNMGSNPDEEILALEIKVSNASN